MPAEIPDEFIDLFERLTEGDLDEGGRSRLVGILRAEPELRGIVNEHFTLSRALSQLEDGLEESRFVETTAAHVVKVAEEGEFGFARKITRRIIRRRIMKVLAAAALVSLAALPFFLHHPARGPQVAVVVRMDPGSAAVSIWPVHAGEKFNEQSGLIRIDFTNGAVMAIEAPAKLTVVSEMEISLESGRLNGWCPESAHGFKVTTASAALTDLGTSFGVTADGSGNAEFMVLDGSVEVNKGGETLRLVQGDAVGSSRKSEIKSVAFDPSGFRNTWPLANGILATQGAVVPADPDIPAKVAMMESDDHVLVIPERREVPFRLPLAAEIVSPGTLPGTLTRRRHSIAPVPGKHLSSFLIRYDPVGTFPPDHFVRFEGEVTFDRPVMAIATQADTLEASDTVFAMGKWESTFRGIELQQINNPPDSVTLSPDRRTVKVVFYAGASTDDIRVFLED